MLDTPLPICFFSIWLFSRYNNQKHIYITYLWDGYRQKKYEPSIEYDDVYIQTCLPFCSLDILIFKHYNMTQIKCNYCAGTWYVWLSHIYITIIDSYMSENQPVQLGVLVWFNTGTYGKFPLPDFRSKILHSEIIAWKLLVANICDKR